MFLFAGKIFAGPEATLRNFAGCENSQPALFQVHYSSFVFYNIIYFIIIIIYIYIYIKFVSQIYKTNLKKKIFALITFIFFLS